METTCQASYPRNSENASPPGTFKAYLSWADMAPLEALTSAVTIAIVRMRWLFITSSSFLKLGGLATRVGRDKTIHLPQHCASGGSPGGARSQPSIAPALTSDSSSAGVVSLAAAMKRCRESAPPVACWSRAVLPIRGRGLDHMGVNRAGLVTAALLALPASALWDTAGHRTVAAIAWEHMTPRARARAVELLLHGPALANFAALRPAPPAQGSEAARDRALFLNAATWADLVRSRDQPWHAYHRPTWHYADFYWDVEHGQPHDIPGTGPDSLNAAERSVALRASLAAPAAATDVLGWTQEGLRVAQTVVYAGVTRGEAPSATYEAEALNVSERRIALAGYRLAALLNEALK